MGAIKIKTKKTRPQRITATVRRTDGKLMKRNRVDGGIGKELLREAAKVNQ